MSKDGGPAFPMSVAISSTGDMLTCGDFDTGGGMTLRDHFAGLAMQGLLAQSQGSAMRSDLDEGAEYAYKMADAMIKARGEGVD